MIRSALGLAVRWDLVAANPAQRVDRPKGQRRPIRLPAPADMARLLAEAPGDLNLYLRLSALTGARRGQLVALRWSDIDLDEATIRFTHALVDVPGKGSVLKATKTGARYPVAIDPRTVDALREHRAVMAERALAVGAGFDDDRWLFSTDPASKVSWRPDAASKRFARHRATLGLTHVRLHDLRHWMATNVLAEGYDIATLTGRGGWANAATPLDIYAHFQPARDRAAAVSLAALIDTPQADGA